jgi:hypothetical protein
MADALEMYFNAEAEGAIRSLWQRLAETGLPSLATLTHCRHRPHVSLAVAESLAGADLAPLQAALVGRQPTLSLYVLGTFPGSEGALFLGVAVTAELLAFHADIHAALADQPAEQWPYYLPGSLVPHCTLAEGLSRTQAAQAFGLLHGYEPVTATVSEFGIKDTATGSVTLLAAGS